MEGQPKQDMHSKIPSIDPGPLGGAPTQGGVVYSDTAGPKISIPEGGGSVPQYANTRVKPIVSVPGQDTETKHREMSFGHVKGTNCYIDTGKKFTTLLHVYLNIQYSLLFVF